MVTWLVHFTWKWCIMIGRKRRENIFFQVIKAKNRKTILDSKQKNPDQNVIIVKMSYGEILWELREVHTSHHSIETSANHNCSLSKCQSFWLKIMMETQVLITKTIASNKGMEKKKWSHFFFFHCGPVREHRPRCLEKRNDWLADCQSWLSVLLLKANNHYRDITLCF